MGDDIVENRVLSAESEQAINNAANWLSEWVTSRYNQGLLSKGEYDQALERLTNARVYTTKNGYDRILEALENGELHVKDNIIDTIVRAYDRNHSSRQRASLSTNEKVVAQFREFLEKNPSSAGLMGFHGDFIKEPVIFLNVDEINKYSQEDVSCPDLESVVVHELTHNLELSNQEWGIDVLLHGNKIIRQRKEPAEKAVAPKIKLSIVPDTGKQVLVHSGEQEDEGYNDGIALKDGVVFDAYLDTPKETYARLMQLRHDFHLQPDESFTPEQIEELERRANVAKERFLNGQTTDKSDIDYDIIHRYKMVRQMLNDVAQEYSDAKSAMHVQAILSSYELAKKEKEFRNSDETHAQENVSFRGNVEGRIIRDNSNSMG